jgi:hypothetical protein
VGGEWASKMQARLPSAPSRNDRTVARLVLRKAVRSRTKNENKQRTKLVVTPPD